MSSSHLSALSSILNDAHQKAFDQLSDIFHESYKMAVDCDCAAMKTDNSQYTNSHRSLIKQVIYDTARMIAAQNPDLEFSQNKFAQRCLVGPD